jgi:1,4-alpha-glucan branching enzyme
MAKGFFSFMLHAHLPFVRHPEYERFLEESWLFEAISETYLPLLRVFQRLRNDAVPFRVTVSFSPTLACMLSDELLQSRYILHLERLVELAEKEVIRTKDDLDFAPLALMYRDLYVQNLKDFTDTYRKNILWGYKALEKEGFLDIITTAATHSFLPLFSQYPRDVEAQIQTAIISHGRIFGERPTGFWLPECGYAPDIEDFLKKNGLMYSFVAAHAVLFSEDQSPYGVYAPFTCPNGVSFFARDIPASQAVWSGEDGYPGDQVYRDFYRDIGYDLPLEYVAPYIEQGHIRVNTGFKYYAITGKTDNKRPYSIAAAKQKIEEHTDNFIYNRMKQIGRVSKLIDRPPVIVTPFDAELFGHWWFEGPLWIESLFRELCADPEGIKMVTPKDYLAMYPKNPVGHPSFSSWGNNGYSNVWLDGSNDWVYRHLHKAIERMEELVERYPDEKGLKARALNQAAREVLLSQASDWEFIIKTGTSAQFAVQTVKEHLSSFNIIYENLCRNTVNTEWLTNIEKRHNIFPDIDYKVFRNPQNRK